MMNNMQMLMNIMKSGGNPQVMLMDMMKSQSQNNPILNNVMQMMQSGNSQGIETVARNLCKERGVDPNQMMNQIKSQFRF